METQKLWILLATAIGVVSSQTDRCVSDIDWMLGQITGGCGGRVSVTAGSPGWIRPVARTDTYHAGGESYDNNMVCVWLLTGPEGTQLQLTQDPSFAFETSGSCIYDKLVIAGTEYCDDNPFVSARISSNKVVATFLSDHVNTQSRGFNIKVEVA